MHINWKLKSAIFRQVDRYRANWLLYCLQKYVTRRARLGATAILPAWERHANAIRQMDSPVILEFGAGKHLAQNLYLTSVCRQQSVVDINPMLDIALVNAAARQLEGLIPGFQAYQLEHAGDLRHYYNIDYKAPFDMRAPRFSSNSIDGCISTNTLEHIPLEDLRQILMELRRVIRSGGLLSLQIDYSDHYAHTDRTIENLHFLRYTQRQWRKYNHRSHYQNRLRHYDYRLLFRQVGLVVKEDVPSFGPGYTGPVAEDFDRDEQTLMACSGYFLLEVP